MYRYQVTDQLAALCARLDELREALDRPGPLPRIWRGRTRRDLEAEATAASVRLEGVLVTADEARRLLVGDRPSEVSTEDAAVTVGYRDAMSLVLARADDLGFTWHPELVLAIHRSVLAGSYANEAGRIRQHQNWLADNATGRVVYTPPPPREVPQLLEELCAWLQESREHPALNAALAHVRLAGIHPFKDGNGRTSRIVASLAMHRGGFKAPQFTSLEEWWGRYPERYYAAFASLGEKFDSGSDVTDFVVAHVSAQASQAEALALRNDAERILWVALQDIAVHDLLLHERATNALYDALFAREVTNRYYRGLAEVSDVTAVSDLRRLVASGLLEARGAGRSARYVGTERLLVEVSRGLGFSDWSPPEGEFSSGCNSLVYELSRRLQTGEVREGSVPYCSR